MWNKPFENIVGKGENNGEQHFLLFPQCFLLLSQGEIFILATFNLSSANAFDLNRSKIFWFGKELIQGLTKFGCIGVKQHFNS